VRDDEPVAAGERVLRIVLVSYVDLGLPQPISPQAFRPSSKDTDGLSVFRERFISPRDLALNSPKQGDCFIVRLSVADISNLKLTVIPDPQQGSLPGHSLIPELKTGATGKKKEEERELRVELARLAGADIVFNPWQK
jgi:hypothetical protein